MHHIKEFCLVFFFVVCSTYTVMCQENQVADIYKYSNNLISNITSISKDNKNFIWISTQDGVYRFDSKNFIKTEVRENLEPSKKWSAIRKICYNYTKNQLVILSPDKGIAILNNLYDTAYFTPLDLPPNLRPGDLITIDTLYENFILSTSKGIFIIGISLNANKKFVVRICTSLLNNHGFIVTKINHDQLAVIDGNKKLEKYVITKNYSFQSIFKISLSEISGVTEIFALDFDKKKCLIGSSDGLYIIEESSHTLRRRKFLDGLPIYFLLGTEDSAYWIAGSNHFWKFDHGHIVKIENNTTDQNDDWLKTVYSLFQDKENNIWLGTQNGLAMLQNKPAAFFSIKTTYKENKSLNHVYHLGLDKNGDLLISSSNGLYRFLNSSKKLAIVKEDKTFFLNFCGPNNKQIVSGLMKTYVIQDNHFIDYTSVFPEFRPFKNLSFNDYEYYKDSLLFLSTENNQGVVRWNYKQKTVEKILFSNGSTIGQTNALYRAADILFILTDSTILSYNIETGVLLKNVLGNKTSQLNYGLFFDMMQVKEEYYITSYGNGIIVTDKDFKVDKIIDEANGLSNNGVYRIVPVSDTSLFISSNNGINILNLKSLSISTLKEADGLHGNIFEEFSSLKANNELYFGGKGGVTIIDPSKIVNRVPKPSLIFLDCKIITNDNQARQISLLGKDAVDIPNTTTQTTINFQNIVYPSSDKIKYAYLIQGFNKDWVTLGSQSFVTLIGMPPGIYHLHIRALNEAGLIMDEKDLELNIIPKWYQTTLFRLVALSLGIFIVYKFYRMRINQFKKEREIRSKLARDLHDDLGSTMNSVNVYTNIALMEVHPQKYLLKIKESTQEAITGIRDIIWVLDDSRNSMEHLLSKVSQFAASLCEANHIKYTTNITDDMRDYQLSQEEKRNLFMIQKEAINNAIKYAAANNIYIKAILNKGKPQISIQDDGKGFDIKKVDRGHGLKNIINRASDINYNVQINSILNSGTIVSLKRS